jgi:hypothetical protein
MAAVADFDDREGPVRERLVGHLQDLFGAVARAAHIAVREGHFRQDLDRDQFAYELWGVVVAYQHYRRLLNETDSESRARRAFRRLVEMSRPVGRA